MQLPHGSRRIRGCEFLDDLGKDHMLKSWRAPDSQAKAASNLAGLEVATGQAAKVLAQRFRRLGIAPALICPRGGLLLKPFGN